MICEKCGTKNEAGDRFCIKCGNQLSSPDAGNVRKEKSLEESRGISYGQPQGYAQQMFYPVISEKQLPEKFHSLSPWAFFLLEIVFAIPIVGLIVALILAIAADNLCLANFARSRFCIFVVIIALIVVAYLVGVSSNTWEMLKWKYFLESLFQ